MKDRLFTQALNRLRSTSTRDEWVKVWYGEIDLNRHPRFSKALLTSIHRPEICSLALAMSNRYHKPKASLTNSFSFRAVF